MQNTLPETREGRLSLEPPLSLDVRSLLRLENAIVSRVQQGRDLGRIGVRAALYTLVGGAVYGCVFGLWRAPEQAAYSALKLPLLLFAIVLASALINGVLALLLRARLGVMQGLVAILLSLSVGAVLLAALAPVALLFVLSVPGPGHPTATAEQLYRTAECVLLFHIVVVGGCAVAGNLRLYRLLKAIVPSPAIARRVLLSWLVVDGFVGTQLSWILRPFLCKPDLEPEFVRVDALDGNFFEEVLRIAQPWLARPGFAVALLAMGVSLAVLGLVKLTGKVPPPSVAVRSGKGPYRDPAPASEGRD